ncbi:MAG TPA: DUF3108 domain-containing protein [Thermoanaerobaculia bacterium]|nr:DUF3108 domain-containing protein [Thermoanaerobaculia bacterium]
MTLTRRMAGGFVLLLSLLLSSPLSAEPLQKGCAPGLGSEELHYSWKLKGALSWIAGLRFPTSGVGALKTVESGGNHLVDSQLLITSRKSSDGFYLYQSQMDPSGEKTLMTFHGYSWGSSHRNERTHFDYLKRLVRTRKESSDDGVENKVKPLPPQDMRDVLTAIYYLRQNAAQITAPVQSQVFSDGKLYTVVFAPAGHKTIGLGSTSVAALGYRISAVPNAQKKFPGDVVVWLSNDNRRLPVRIEVQQSLASLELNLQSVDGCS